MSYHIEYIPQPHDRSNFLKGNGEKVDGHSRKIFNDENVFYRDGMGCSIALNCFECLLTDCVYTGSEYDKKFIKNPGNGVKVMFEG